ncbi:MAG: CPBP family intramembrane metalloprotease [Ardenticatenaceae bacterium]|nr:CPBP family intramembrane metalloprotease [Anaerolineales bacterium]MCB8922768.1 CPBP family intramembrane metalloprotease [Ardenticatenaceae bacterium]
MKAFRRLAERRPVGFAFLLLLIWVVIAGLVNGLVITLFKTSLDNPIALQAGNLISTCVLLLMAQSLGWFHKIGIAKLGVPSIWLVTFALAIYIVLVGFYAFFEDFTFAFGTLYATQESRNILLQSLLAGFVEETVFRGVLLYAFVRVWGKTRRGIIASVMVQAALFGVLHSLQIFAGVTTDAAMANVLETFIFGILTGAVVLLGGTIWPAIFLHLVSNAFLLIKGLSSPWIDLAFIGYLRQASMESFVALICLWIVLKKKPAQHVSLKMNLETSTSK